MGYGEVVPWLLGELRVFVQDLNGRAFMDLLVAAAAFGWG